MKSKLELFVSVIQLIDGSLGIALFAILAFNGENMLGWIVTLVFFIAFVVMGIRGIIDYKSKR